MPRKLPVNELASREEFFKREQQTWKALTSTWSNLSETALLQRGAAGTQWNVKDVMNHIATWQETGLRMIDDLQAGRWARLGTNTDSFNHQHYLEDRERSLAASQKRLRSVRSKLLRRLRTLSEPELLNEFGRQAIGWWAKWTTYAHYEEHIPTLQEFVSRQSVKR
jgi:hypothetical protein